MEADVPFSLLPGAELQSDPLSDPLSEACSMGASAEALGAAQRLLTFFAEQLRAQLPEQLPAAPRWLSELIDLASVPIPLYLLILCCAILECRRQIMASVAKFCVMVYLCLPQLIFIAGSAVFGSIAYGAADHYFAACVVFYLLILCVAARERWQLIQEYVYLILSNALSVALTAFAVINSENLPDSIRSAVPEWFFWIAPSIVLAPILILWRKRYERQFSNNHGAA